MINHNTIIVAGTGQNVGKTTLICNIISHKKEKSIYAIKISPHFHKLTKSDKILVKTNNYLIVDETKINTGKDSAKMLKAGAKKVFYVQCSDEYLPDVFNEIDKLIPKKTNIIIESGGARNIFIPNLFIMLKSPDNSQIKIKSAKLLSLADDIITFENNTFNFNYSIINEIWK